MEKVQEESLRKALMMLAAVGCTYEVKDPDGQVYKFGQKKVAKRVSSESVKTITKVVTENLSDIVIGEIKFVPMGDLDIVKLQASCSAFLRRRFGKGCFATKVNHEKGCIEALRFA